MEWQVSQSNNPEEEINNAVFENIRLFTVPRTVADTPQSDCVGEWTVCSPATVRNFSAVGYFFGREIHKNLKVPVGLIHSSWGGTPIESWMEQTTLRNDADFVPILDRYKRSLEEYPERLKEYNELVKKIEEEGLELPPYQIDKGNKGLIEGWAEKDYNDSDWENIELPGYWEGIINKDIDGALWFRYEISLPENLMNKDLTLELGPIDDFDVTYFNGRQIGSIGDDTPNFWTTPRVYKIDKENIKEKNSIAVRVFDHYGEGGFSGSPSQMKIYAEGEPDKSIQISGIWKYRIESALDPKNVSGPGGGKLPPAPMGPGHPHSPSGLYNAMIYPIAPYALKGFIWYQGETNASRAYQYRKLLPAMINDWRILWKDPNLYFGIVQLANFMAVLPDPSESAWAELREAQAISAFNDPLNGLAVTIDIGEADDIHPKNKQDVGKRLAFWSLKKVYAQNSFNEGTDIFSGPVMQNYEITGDTISISFDHVGKGLIAQGDSLHGFTIAGEDKNFFWAQAIIEGNNVRVWSDKVKKPAAVRYAWANNPICNLYNSGGLPAVPFRTDDWPGATFGSK
jgi:sialate O-acetylesterase